MPTFVHQVQLELTFSPERYAVSNNEWHFVAFSFDSFSKRGIVVLDDHVEKFAAPGAAIFDAAFDQHKVLVGGNRLAPENNFRGAMSCVQGSAQQSRLLSQSAFHFCIFLQLLNTKKNVQFRLILYFNLQF